MIARAPGLGVGVGRVSRPLRGVGVLEMPDAGLDTSRRVQTVCMVQLGAGLLRLLVPGVAVGVIIDRHCVPDVGKASHCAISSTRELFSEDEGVEC
jgi:hypothetical protein